MGWVVPKFGEGGERWRFCLFEFSTPLFGFGLSLVRNRYTFFCLTRSKLPPENFESGKNIGLDPLPPAYWRFNRYSHGLGNQK